jgi:hypothetical protein
MKFSNFPILNPESWSCGSSTSLPYIFVFQFHGLMLLVLWSSRLFFSGSSVRH